MTICSTSYCRCRLADLYIGDLWGKIEAGLRQEEGEVGRSAQVQQLFGLCSAQWFFGLCRAQCSTPASKSSASSDTGMSCGCCRFAGGSPGARQLQGPKEIKSRTCELSYPSSLAQAFDFDVEVAEGCFTLSLPDGARMRVCKDAEHTALVVGAAPASPWASPLPHAVLFCVSAPAC